MCFAQAFGVRTGPRVAFMAITKASRNLRRCDSDIAFFGPCIPAEISIRSFYTATQKNRQIAANQS